MSENQSSQRGAINNRWLPWILFFAVALVTIAVLALLSNIHTRKAEGRQVVFQLVELGEDTIDPKIWAKNFPRQYDSYIRTVDVERTRHGGSDAFQKLDEFPRWKEIFAGYAFGVDYREERGHAYMLQDQRETVRVTQFSQPGACLHCHASDIPAYRQVGLEHGAGGTLQDPFESQTAREQLMKGFEVVCAMPLDEATKLVEHPVACIDCHDPETMQLRVTRPAFLNGIDVLARSSDPLPHLPSIERWRKGDRSEAYNPNQLATRQEMRSLACAQCHVEYYFKGEGKLLTYPWHNGLQAEESEAYYDEQGFKDWTHALTGAPVLKAQHPEFEFWSQGIHARSGVSCADCHMPYIREGAVKVSSHHVRSPLLDVAHSCQTCHRYSEEELIARAEGIQDKTKEMMDRAEIAVVALIGRIETAMAAGAGENLLNQARDFQRKAQWRLDFVAAENSLGFHADQEAARLLGTAIDLARQGEIALLNGAPAEAEINGGEQ